MFWVLNISKCKTEDSFVVRSDRHMGVYFFFLRLDRLPKVKLQLYLPTGIEVLSVISTMLSCIASSQPINTMVWRLQSIDLR